MNTLYLDMDGVLADFKGYAMSILKKPVNDANVWPAEEWARLKDNPRIYRDLDKTVYADYLVEECERFCESRGYELKILTAIPKNNDIPWAFYDKMNWCQNYFPQIPVMFGPYAVDKANHCKSGDILIDDRISTIIQWNTADGYGIYHTGDVKKTVATLNAYLI